MIIASRVPPPVVMEEVTDAVQIALAREQWERFERNWAWLREHTDEAYAHLGKCICIAGQELFVADTVEEVLALAKAAHPDEDGRFTLYVPRKRMARIYTARLRPDYPSSSSKKSFDTSLSS